MGNLIRSILLSLICLLPVSSLAFDSPAESLVEIKGNWFYVNGEKFLIKGIGYSPWRPHELPWKVEVPESRLREDFERIRAAGFNTLRTWTPMPLEQLRIAREYGLMVIQGIYLNNNSNYNSDNYLRYSINKVRREIRDFKNETNVLMVLVTNEPPVEKVSRSGRKETEDFLKKLVFAAKQEAPHLAISYSNWTQLAFLDTSYLDCAAFNVYMAKPVSVRHSMGYLPYLRWLKETHAKDKPLVVTEFGLSVNPTGKGAFAEGGNTLDEQARGLVRMWSQILASGAAGGCVFEWNDEWWKNYEYPGDENKHEDEPEEWYGILDIDQDPAGVPRPAYEALKKFNSAIVVSPNRYTGYQGKIDFEINAIERVSKVQVRVNNGDWQDLTTSGSNWWTGSWTPSDNVKGRVRYLVRAFDQYGNLVSEKKNFFYIEPLKELAEEELFLNISIDPPSTRIELKPTETKTIKITFKVTDKAGNPVPKRRVFFSFNEVVYNESLKGARFANEQGEVSFDYIVQQPGFIIVSAGTGYYAGDRVARLAAVKHLEIIQVKSKYASNLPKPDFELINPGTEFPVDYTRYGEFKNLNTPDYLYKIKNLEGLAEAVGTGIYPDEYTIYNEPIYKKYQKSGKLKGYHWDFVAEEDTAASFLKWVIAPEEPFVKLFYSGAALQRANLFQHAIKSFYAILVHSPGGVGWTYFGTPWSLGKTAMDRIEWLTRKYPQLGVRLEGASLEIKNGFDNNPMNDIVICNPGKLVKVDPKKVVPEKRDFKNTPVIKTLGGVRTKLVQYQTGDWELLVNGKTYMVKGITYVPTKVGNSPHEGTMEDWMTYDTNNNGKADGPYDAWVDWNKNNRQDSDEPVVGDFQLLKEMGANTIRIYHHASNKKILRDLYKNYGIRVLMGDFIGMYNVGSGATWEEGTDYRDPEQRARMLESIREMVMRHKDEDYVLFWVLGNENNYGGVEGDVGGKGNASLFPDAYYGFVNEAAKMIKELDPSRPVAICNGDLYLLDKVAEYAPEIDIYGMNTYRGPYGFGRSLWNDIKQVYDRPVVITEYGCPSFHPGASLREAEHEQALYNKHAWEDMEYNSAGSGAGNSIGGILFQFVDGWWKSGQPPTFSPYLHETLGQFPGPFPAGWFYEEWFGITGQGNGQHSPFMRQLRESYFTFKDLWTK